MTTQCAWCRRVQANGEWMLGTPFGLITHGICPACSVRLKIEVDRYLKQFEMTRPVSLRAAISSRKKQYLGQ